MKKSLLTLFTLAIFSTFACAQKKSEPLTEERFISELVMAFEAQANTPEINNGTLHFLASNEANLSTRNGSLMLQVPAQPFIEAGLEGSSEVRIGNHILFNGVNQTLFIAFSAMQTMDMQYIDASEIAGRLYQATQREESPFSVSEADGFIIIDDGVLTLQWNQTSFRFGIHKDLLTNAGVDLAQLNGFSLAGDFMLADPL
jgi:hypothetical protein